MKGIRELFILNPHARPPKFLRSYEIGFRHFSPLSSATLIGVVNPLRDGPLLSLHRMIPSRPGARMGGRVRLSRFPSPQKAFVPPSKGCHQEHRLREFLWECRVIHGPNQHPSLKYALLRTAEAAAEAEKATSVQSSSTG